MSDQPHDAEKFPEVSDRDAQQNGGPAHVPERRIHPRRRVASLEYVDLGGGNGGIIINLGEDGMYVQAVGGLIDADLPLITFHVPESGHRVETSGRIIWAGETKKDAGIQFTNLPEEVRTKIREWISSEKAAVETADESEAMPEMISKSKARERIGESPSSHPLQKIVARPLVSRRSVPSGARLSDSPAIHTIFGSSAPPKLSVPDDFTRAPSERIAPSSRLAAAYVQYRNRLGLAAIVVLVAVASLFAGWIATRSKAVKQAIALNPNLTPGEPAPANTLPPPASITANANASSTPVQISPSRKPTAVSPHTNVAATAPTTFANTSTAPHQTAPRAQPLPAAHSSAPLSTTSSASPSVNQPLAAPRPALAERLPTPAPTAGPSPQNSPEPAAGVVKGMISVTASPYSSPRLPAGLKPKVAGQSNAVQIGPLISSVEPVYPESAERDRVEGVVKLRAIIGTDGTVRDIDQSSGPPPLVNAAAAAVQQWRYTPTTVGGHPVEAEVSITITFRLQVLPASTN